MIIATTPKTPRLKFIREYEALLTENYRYLIYYGGRSGGKSRATAQALLIRGENNRKRILCTREVQNTIRDSVHKLLKDIIEKYELSHYEVMKDTIINRKTGSEFIFKGLKHNITEIKSMEGVDICWVEEGQAITKESLDILTPTIRKPGSQIIITFNRFNELDPVYEHFVINKPPKTYIKKINYDVLERAGLLPDVIKDEIEADKATPSLFAYKWLGEPISQSETAILSRDNVLLSMQREIEDDGLEIIGVDVARMGDDRTVFWKRKGLKTTAKKVFSHLRTTEICDQLERFAEPKPLPGFSNDDATEKAKLIQIKIDDTGVGGGVTDEMMKRGYNVVPINFGAKAKDDNKYPNLISEAWFEFATNLNDMQLPMDSDLLMELTTRQWLQDNKGKRKAEPKADYKKRGFRSPDLADACIICYYTPKIRTTKAYSDKPSVFAI